MNTGTPGRARRLGGGGDGYPDPEAAPDVLTPEPSVHCAVEAASTVVHAFTTTPLALVSWPSPAAAGVGRAECGAGLVPARALPARVRAASSARTPASRDLDPALVAAVIYAESRFDPNARSTAGAVGLMQVLPETGEFIARKTGGERLRRRRSPRSRRSTCATARGSSTTCATTTTATSRRALAAYHAGPGNVDEWRRTDDGIAFPETRAYVDEVERVRSVYAQRVRARARADSVSKEATSTSSRARHLLAARAHAARGR